MFRTKALLSGIVTIALAGFLTACSRTEAPAAEAETAATPEATEAAPEATAPPAAAPANSVAANKTPAPAPAPKPASKPSAPKTPPASSSSASGWGDAPASTTPAAPVARTYTLPAGTSIKIRTTSTLSTKNQTTGETFAASLAEPLEVDGRVIAERGANVTGRIVNSDPGIQLVNGQSVSLSTNAFEQQADSSVKKDAAKVAIGSGIGAAIGAIAGGGKGAAIGAGVGAGAGTGTVLATRGNDAVIPAESLITFNTRSSVSVELR
jgi:hypothetical protein